MGTFVTVLVIVYLCVVTAIAVGLAFRVERLSRAVAWHELILGHLTQEQRESFPAGRHSLN